MLHKVIVRSKVKTIVKEGGEHKWRDFYGNLEVWYIHLYVPGAAKEQFSDFHSLLIKSSLHDVMYSCDML